MTIERQIEIMEVQLDNFDTLMEKMYYMSNYFDPDPDFCQKARDIVRSNISKGLKS